MSDLKPCPKCKGPATVSYTNGYHWAHCAAGTCFDWRGVSHPTEAEAIAAWNTREGV